MASATPEEIEPRPANTTTDIPVTQNGTDETHAVLEWLCPFDFRRRQETLFKASSNIWDWYLEDEVFKNWTKGRPWQLRCYGMPRSGKTHLSAIVADHLRTNTPPNSAVVSLFLADIYTQDNPPVDASRAVQTVMSSILRQLIEASRLPMLSARLRAVSRLGSQSVCGLALDSLREHISAAIDGPQRTYIILDGLDHCPEDVRSLLKVELGHLPVDSVSVMVTSYQLETISKFETTKLCDRPDCSNKVGCSDPSGPALAVFWNCDKCDGGCFDVCQECYDSGRRCKDDSHQMREPYDQITLVLTTWEQDLVKYITEELDSMKDLIGEPDSEEDLDGRIRSVADSIAKKAAGKFAIADCWVDHISRTESMEDVDQVLDRLLDEEMRFFRFCLDKIESQQNEDRALAWETLFLLAKKGKLQLCDLEEELGSRKVLEYGSEPPLERILRVTHGMIELEDTVTLDVRLCHVDLQIYLNQEAGAPTPDVNTATVPFRSLVGLGSDTPIKSDDLNMKLRSNPPSIMRHDSAAVIGVEHK